MAMILPFSNYFILAYKDSMFFARFRLLQPDARLGINMPLSAPSSNLKRLIECQIH